jgi:hypothetical protein
MAGEKVPDPFDPERYRLTQNFDSAGVKKLVLTVPVVSKPSPEWFSRVHLDPDFRMSAAVLELRDTEQRGETYLVDPNLVPYLQDEPTCFPAEIFTGVNRQGVVFLWRVKLPKAGRSANAWTLSNLEGATRAQTDWVRITSNMSLGAYEVAVATAALPEPTWPEMSFGELLRISFKDHIIDSLDHPVLKQLRGEE